LGGKKLCYGGNETTTNAEPDNFPFCIFVPFPKAPRRYQSFCVEATKEILRFLFASFAFSSISIQPSLDPISFDRACLAGQLYFFVFLMRNTNKTSQLLTSLTRAIGHLVIKYLLSAGITNSDS
jgi:hypothetical protein